MTRYYEKEMGTHLLRQFISFERLTRPEELAHRVYLSQGIYAEVTLRYHHGAFHPFEYTYPDYSWPETHDFLKQLRRLYLEQLRQQK